jgi:vacuolar-type H+-ATPase subunit F/Vma7
MDDVIFIGDRNDAIHFRNAGIPAYAPANDALAERVLAERLRCRILAMRERTFQALPNSLARELREGPLPKLKLLPEDNETGKSIRDIPRDLRRAALGGKF